ncbi:plasmid pRiA4b ORF-3 family protein [Flavobacteriaceae bacterium F08102]|nr:plasmid pRiA4b ORF-3 family protein [Flavobacteriaceae bacterium F08102]
MIYKIRLILDTEEDVIRDVLFDPSDTLEDLHNGITNAFGFDGTEMASFYLSDEEWNQGAEIPLFDMEENASTAMQNFKLSDVLHAEKKQLIYVYDFFSMWTFFVELVSIEEDLTTTELPKLILSVGQVPSTAPEKEFKSEDVSTDDDFNSLDNFDEFDFDNFDDLMN